MLAVSCWFLRRDALEARHKKKQKRCTKIFNLLPLIKDVNDVFTINNNLFCQTVALILRKVMYTEQSPVSNKNIPISEAHFMKHCSNFMKIGVRFRENCSTKWCFLLCSKIVVVQCN